MQLLAVSFLIFTLSALGMAIGLILRGRPIRSGCASLNGSEGGPADCRICRGTCERKGRENP
jgi:hypothetical protein